MVKKNEMSAKVYILKALIPYSEQNLKLTFHPAQFFYDVERLSGYPHKTLRQTYSRLKHDGFITGDKEPVLTLTGRQSVQPFVAKKLQGGGQLMVIFDIPEEFSDKRRKLRNLLRFLGFIQIQRSVWVSPDDHVRIVQETIEELQLSDWVELYESSKI